MKVVISCYHGLEGSSVRDNLRRQHQDADLGSEPSLFLPEVPISKETRRRVVEGVEICYEIAKETGLLDLLAPSIVHSSRDPLIQAEQLALMTDDPFEQRIIGALTMGSHLADDLLDPPACCANREIFSSYRLSPNEYLNLDNPLSRFCREICDLSPNPSGPINTIVRVGYSSLIIHAPQKIAEELIAEHNTFALQNIDPLVAESLTKIDSRLYSYTSKGAQALAESVRSDFDLTLSEIWTAIYTPALLFDDLKAEIENGEMPKIEANEAFVQSAAHMIREATKWISQYEVAPQKRLLQIQSVTELLSEKLPSRVLDAYGEVVQELTTLLRR